jgi:inosose dehydratase
MQTVKWSYALNQWKQTYDMFVRREYHERAFKTLSACGFRAVEVSCGPGRWEPFGNLEMINANYGDVAGFQGFLASCGIEAVSSYFLEPGAFLAVPGGMPLSAGNPAHHAQILALAGEYLELLPQLGGSTLVLNVGLPFWRFPELGDEVLATHAACWSAIGREAATRGLQVALHLNCLSAFRDAAAIARLLAAVGHKAIGLALDTAEMTLAGLDPLACYIGQPTRVTHFHFKDVKTTDTLGEYRGQHAEHNMLSAGGQREIARWFYEMGTPGGLVDFPALVAAQHRQGYGGWVVVESDQSLYPATSAMLNAWYVQHKLGGFAGGKAAA